MSASVSTRVTTDASSANATITTPTTPGLYAVIDIGTVTCRYLLLRIDENGTCRTLDRGYKICNLGVGVDAGGYLRKDAMARVAEAVEEFVSRRDAAAAERGEEIPTVCVATSAARDARNGDEFRALLAAKGVVPAIIPGEQEAALSFAGAGMDFAGQPVIVVDIGGGSTEIIAGVGGGKPDFAHSFNIGCRRLTERFFRTDPPTAEELAAAGAWVREEMLPYVEAVRAGGFAGATVVAVAGTATSVVAVDLALEPYDGDKVQGAVVTAETLDAVFARLAAVDAEARRQVVGLDPKRADVIVAGVLILRVVLELFSAPVYVASEADLMHGAALALARGERFATVE